MAFGNVAARLLAIGTICRCHSERSRGIPPKNLKPNATGSLDFARDDDKEARPRENPAVRAGGSIRDDHFHCAVSWWRGAHTCACSYYIPAVERACVLCEIPTARVLAA